MITYKYMISDVIILYFILFEPKLDTRSILLSKKRKSVATTIVDKTAVAG